MTSIEEQYAARHKAMSAEQDAKKAAEYQKWLDLPRSQKALPASAFITSKYKRNADAVRYWTQTKEQRDAEDANLAKEAGLDITEVRRLLSESHPDHGGTDEAFIAAKKKLDALRKK